jgi:hypothetical protein
MPINIIAAIAGVCLIDLCYIYLYIHTQQDATHRNKIGIVRSRTQATDTEFSSSGGRPIAQVFCRWLPSAVAQVGARDRSCEICGGLVALGQVGFPCQSLHRLLHTRHIIRG